MIILIDLRDAQPDSAGPKAGVLGELLRSGFPVPPGFVIPTSVYAMAVLVQSLVHATVSGVLFTDGAVRIEAIRGFGDALVSGRVTPDSWLVADGTVIERHSGNQPRRADRRPRGGQARPWPSTDPRFCLTDQQVLLLTELGLAIEHHLGQPQDVEWAIAADGQPSILQSRPVTARMPSLGGVHRTSTALAHPATNSRSAVSAIEGSVVLVGVAAGPGSARGPVRIVRGLDDFARIRPGDVLVCPTTDPAWTPLFRIAAAVVTEQGGLLCHAAIVARESGIPAVLAVPTATTALIQGRTVEVDGDRGTVLLQ